jgi:hypothetical protein
MSPAISLTVKQRRFVRHYLETGNGTEAAMVAYDVADRNTARSIGTENLRKPAVQGAVAELLDAAGLSDEKLLAIHAHYLGLYASADPRMKAIGLKALDMAYRLKGAYAPERPRIETAPHVPAEALERVARVLREVHEFEHPQSPFESGRVSDSRRCFLTVHSDTASLDGHSPVGKDSSP